MDTVFGRGFRPQHATVKGEVLDDVGGCGRFGRCVAHPCVARGLERSESDDVGRQRCITADAQVRCRNDSESVCGRRLGEQGRCHAPPGLMLADPTNPLFTLQRPERRGRFGWQANQPPLIVQHVQDGQVVLLHEAFQHSTVRGVELEHHHAGVGCIVGASVAVRHLWPTSQQGIKRAESKVQQSRGRHQGNGFHGGLRHHAPVGSGHRQALLLCHRLGGGLQCIFGSIVNGVFGKNRQRCRHQQEKNEQERRSRTHGMRTGQGLLKVALACADRTSARFTSRCMQK